MAKARRFVLVSLAVAAFAGAGLMPGCTSGGGPRVSAEEAARDPQFLAWYRDLTLAMKADPQYRQLPIDSDAEAEAFSARLHQAYRHKLSVADFTRWLDYTYPGHSYEVAFITSRLPRQRQ